MDTLDTLSIVYVLYNHQVVDAEAVVLAESDGFVAGDREID